MALSKEEQKFIESIKNKINLYDIPVKFEDCINQLSGIFRETKYNDDTIETVDVEIERFLIYNSANYFLTKYGIIPVSGLGYIPFHLYYCQKNALYNLQNYKFNIALKSRQVGFSTLSALYALWKVIRENKLETVDVISMTEKKAKEFKLIIEETIRRIPLWILPKIRDSKTDEFRFVEKLNELPRMNQTELILGNGSIIKCETASSNAGRGSSTSLLIIDEAAFFDSEDLITKIWASAFPTIIKTKGDVIVISTPNGITNAGSWYYNKLQEAKEGLNNFHITEICWWEIPDEDKGINDWLYELIDKDYCNHPDIKDLGKEKAKYEEVNWKNNKWLKIQRTELGEVTYRQEILHDFIITGDNVFPSERLEQLQNRIKRTPPISKDVIENEAMVGMWIWKKPVKGKNYIIGVDTARGTGHDLSAIEVFDPVELEQVAEFRSLIPTKRLGQIVKKIALYYNTGFVIIECNGIGESVFNEVFKHDVDPYENVFKTFATKKGVQVITGWETTQGIRKLITDEFINWMADDQLFSMLKIHSQRILDEMTTWIWTDRGPDHASKQFDDCVMAFCLCLYNRQKAGYKNEILMASSLAEYNMHTTLPDKEQLIMEYQIAGEENYDKEEIKEINKKDPIYMQYGVEMADYEWLLGMNSSKEDKI